MMMLMVLIMMMRRIMMVMIKLMVHSWKTSGTSEPGQLKPFLGMEIQKFAGNFGKMPVTNKKSHCIFQAGKF